MGFDRFFGFDQIQRKTLARLLAEIPVEGLTPEQEEALELVASIPTSDPEVAGEVWNDNGVLKVSQGA